MPLPQKKLIPGLLLALVVAAFAAPPLWWSDGNPPVINANPANNKGPANIGQAKHMAKSALDALRPILPGVADQIEADLVGPGKPIPSWAAPATQTERDKNHAPLLIGQLKAIADPFYTRLHAAAPAWLEAERIANGTHHPGSIFPWTSAVSDDNNKGVANIGQLKAVFSLRFETLATFDSDGDGMPDLWEIENGFDPNDPADANADSDGDGISNQQERDLRTDPNSFDQIGPVNLGFDEQLNPGAIVTTFRNPNPSNPPAPPEEAYDPYTSDYHPSDLYGQGSVPGWQAALGDHIEIWDETIEPRHPGDPDPYPSPYVELQSHWGDKGIKQQFNMLPGTTITFVLGYKGRYYWDGYANPFSLKVEGAQEVLINGQPAQTQGSAKQESFMEDDTWEKYAEWHYASVSITADPLATKLVPITLTLIPEDTNEAITYGGFVDLLPVEVGVDNNRDGTLRLIAAEDQTSVQKPYRFWLNNDDDTGWAEDTYIANRDNPWTPSVVDSLDEKIKEARDLEDFARIHLNVESLHSKLAAGTMTLGLKWRTVQSGAPKIRLFKAVEADGGTKYISDTAKAADQVTASTSAIGVVQGTTVLDLPVSFWASTASSQTKYFLFEAIGEGKGELTIVFKEGATVVGEGGSVFFDLLDIRKMYEQWGINPAAVIPDPDRDVLLPISGVTAVPYLTAGQAFQPAWDENLEDKNYVICVHGWRKGGHAAATLGQLYKGRSDEITMFKRLWHRGFKGRYIGFIWPTYDVEVGTQSGIDAIQSALQSKFNHSEYRAWKCGEAFKSMVNGLPAEYKKKVFAHSLGNVVVGSALEKGMTVDNYALLNAAISARCYHKATPTPLFALNEDMSDDPTAAVRALSYRGDAASLGHARLEKVGGKISNFYLPDDSALSLLGAGWALNQTTLKPDPQSNYEYENIPGFGFHEVQWHPLFGIKRVITDPHEGMAMVNASWSKAVGSISVLAGVGGTGIDTNINMSGPGMAFADEHEAAFKWECAKTWVFYSKLWDELNLPGIKSP